MDELNLVLDTVFRTWSLFLPFVERMHLFEICISLLVIGFSMSLVIPVIGKPVKASLSQRSKTDYSKRRSESKGD